MAGFLTRLSFASPSTENINSLNLQLDFFFNFVTCQDHCRKSRLGLNMTFSGNQKSGVLTHFHIGIYSHVIKTNRRKNLRYKNNKISKFPDQIFYFLNMSGGDKIRII